MHLDNANSGAKDYNKNAPELEIDQDFWEPWLRESGKEAPSTPSLPAMLFTGLDKLVAPSRQVRPAELTPTAAEDGSSPSGAEVLKTMLSSPNQQVRKDAERLLRILQDPNDRTGLVIVDKVLGTLNGPEKLRQLFSVMDDPKQKYSVPTLLEGFKSDKAADAFAAADLLALMTKTDYSDADKKSMITMFADKTKREDVSAILYHLSEPRQLNEMLKILADPAMDKAGKTLMDMLRTDYGGKRVAELLKSPYSEIDVEQRQGRQLLQLLNSTKPGDKEAAEKVLRVVDSLHHRSHVLALLEDEKTRQGAHQLLDILDRTSSRAAEPGRKLLEMLCFEGQSENAKKLVTLLGGDKNSQETAELLLRKFDSPTELSAMLQVLEKDKPLGTMILSWLNDPSMEKRTAAKALILGRSEGRHREAYDQVGKMLLDPKQADAARAILKLEDPDLVSKLMHVRSQSIYASASDKLMSMLSSSDYSHRVAATNLLRMLTANGGGNGAPSDGRAFASTPDRLLLMLGSKDESAIATRLLAKGSDAFDAGKVLKIMDRDKQSFERLLNLMDREPEIGRAVLQNSEATKTESLSELLNLLDAKSQIASRMRKMIDSKGPQNLADLLASKDEKEREAGKQIVKQIETSTRIGEPIEGLLKADLSPSQLSQIMALRNSKDTYQAGVYLSKAAQNESNSSVKDFLDLCKQGDPSAQHLLKLMNDPAKHDVVTTVLSAELQSGQFKKLCTLAADEKLLAPIVSLLNAGESDQAAAGRLLSMIDGKYDNSGREILSMISSKDPEQQEFGKNIARLMELPDDMDRCIAMLKQADSPEMRASAEKLRALLASKNFDDRRAAANLVQLYRVGSSELGDKLFKMLGSKENGKDAELILTRLQNSGQVNQLIRLMSNPQAERASTILLDMLKNPDQMKKAVLFLDALDSPLRTMGIIPRGVDEEVKIILRSLNDPKTSDLAREALCLAHSIDSLMLPAQLLQSAGMREYLQKLVDLSKKPEHKATIEAVMNGITIPQQLETFLNLIESGDKAGTDYLIDKLKDPEAEQRQVALQLLQLLRGNAQQRKPGETLLKMAADPKTRDLAEKLVSRTNADAVAPLVKILENPKFKIAAEAIEELLTSEDPEDARTVMTLVSLMEGRDSAAEGARYLAMLNSANHRATAVRLLELRRQRYDSKPFN